MADFDDRTSLSRAPVGRTLNEPIPRPTGYTPSSRLAQIDDYLSNLSTASLESYPIDTPKYYFKIAIGQYTRNSDMDVADVKSNGGIILPVPMQMQDALGINYEQVPLGWTGAVVMNTFSKIPEISNQRAAEQLGRGAVAGTIGSALKTVGSLGSIVTGRNIADSAIQGVQAAWGIAPNQFLTILLRGPQYKNYTLSWKFAPKNEKESQILYNIIRRLNNEASPTVDWAALIFRFPSIFQCSFNPNENQMYKFKPAVLTNVVTNYAGSGMPAFYKSGYPESIELQLTFLELEFWLKGDFT